MDQDPSSAEGSAPQLSDKAMISAMLGGANIFFLCILVAGFFACASEFDTSICFDDPSWPRFFVCSLFLSALAIITGRSARSDIEKSNGRLEGSRPAQLGIALGRLGIITLGLALVALAILAIIALGSI